MKLAEALILRKDIQLACLIASCNRERTNTFKHMEIISV